MKSAKKVLDWVLNVLTVVVALFLVGMAARHYLAPNQDLNPALRHGALVSLSGINWAEQGRTLVIAMQVGCHWCEESADFYRDILASNSKNTFHAVAVLPQSALESKVFLDSLGVHFSDLRQAEIRTLGVSGTPTLILVDRTGHVESSWVGKLLSEQENAVFKELGVKRVSAGPGDKTPMSGALDSDAFTGKELHRMTQTQHFVPVIDIRPRANFNKSHIAGSLNIPLDELEARAEHEVPKDVSAVMYCDYYAACERKLKAQGVSSYCSLGRLVLEKHGFSRIKILKENLGQIERAGVLIVRAPELVARKAPAAQTAP
jgi:hypothetical protein